MKNIFLKGVYYSWGLALFSLVYFGPLWAAANYSNWWMLLYIPEIGFTCAYLDIHEEKNETTTTQPTTPA